MYGSSVYWVWLYYMVIYTKAIPLLMVVKGEPRCLTQYQKETYRSLSSMNMNLVELIICTLQISYLLCAWCTVETRGLYRNPHQKSNTIVTDVAWYALQYMGTMIPTGTDTKAKQLQLTHLSSLVLKVLDGYKMRLVQHVEGRVSLSSVDIPC